MFKNFKYYLTEIKTILGLDLGSNILSVISLGFIFFLLLLILSGGIISNHWIQAIESEAEISVYYTEVASPNWLIQKIEKISGVSEAVLIDEIEAKDRMEKIMGEESRILELFDHNPFSAYIEVKILLENFDSIVEETRSLNGVDYVRDNKEILDTLKNISSLMNLIGLVIMAVAGITTIIITSHVIRQGIYANKEEMNTLRLLGAPEGFITFPFAMTGMLISLLSGFFSIAVITAVLSYVYKNIINYLPFMVLPDFHGTIYTVALVGLGMSLFLGITGSIIGLKSTKK